MKKINKYSLLVNLIFLLLLSSFFYKFTGPYKINTLLGIALVVDNFWIFVTTLPKRKSGMLIFLVILFTVSLTNIKDLSIYSDHFIYFVNTLALLSIMISERTREKIILELNKRYKLGQFLIIFLCAVTMVTVFIDSCYEIVTLVKVYVGFSYGEHAIATNLCLLFVLMLYYRKFFSKKVIAMIVIIITYGIFQTGARSYLLSIMMLLFIYYKLEFSEYSLKYLIIPVALLGLVIIIKDSTFIEKNFIKSTNINISDTFLYALTSGRIIWWKIDIESFKNLGIIQKLIGVGNDFIYEINSKYYGLRIWAHNDYLQVLIAEGIIGLTGYLAVMVSYIKNFYFVSKNVLGKAGVLAISLYIIPVAFTNGFYIANQYVLSTIVLMLVFENNRKRLTHV